MLYGFQIFVALRAARINVVEVHPYTIIKTLVSACPHKSTETGYRLQLEAIATATGWKPTETLRR